MNSLIRSVILSLKALRSNPSRTVLTTMGVVIGIATVIVVFSAGAGFRSLIDAQVAALGTNTLYIQTQIPTANKQRAASSSSETIAAAQVTTLHQRDLDDVSRLANVHGVYGMVTGTAVTSYRNVKKSIIYIGASAERFQIDQSKLQSGRFYTSAEDSGGAQVVILGAKLADSLFPQGDAVGKLLHLGTTNFQIIGVYAPSGGLGGTDDMAIIPLQTAQKKMLGIDYLSRAVVQLDDNSLAAVTTEQITQVLDRNHRITDVLKADFLITSQAQALDTFNTIFGGITLLLIAIAAISLVVGGVGIMNIMYVVVTERTAEIGLKKAVGATTADIRTEFLVESVIVTLIGGVIGTLVGAVLGWIVSVIATANQLAWVFSVPWYAIVIAVGVSTAIGIGFGVFPALSAARMDPITALQYE